jgi:hypothetical protein
VGGRGGATGGSIAAGDSSATALGKDKQTCVIINDDEVSSDEYGPLQKRLRQLSGAGPAVLDEVAAADKEVADKRAVEEATVKRLRRRGPQRRPW